MPQSPTAAYYSPVRGIYVDGEAKAGLRDNGLVRLLVEENSEGMCRCEAAFSNWGNENGSPGYLHFNRDVLDFGKSLRFNLGDGEAAGDVFDGKITALEGVFPQSESPELRISAEDGLQELRMTRRTRTFEDVSDEDVFREIASAHNLTPDIDITGPSTHKVLAQVNQSDLAFARERARAIDAEIWVAGTTLHAQARARRDGGEVTLAYGDRLLEFSVLADLSGQCTGLTVTGWDFRSKQGISFQTDNSAVSQELAGGQGGGAVLEQAFGARKQQLVHAVPDNDEEARHFGESHFRRQARRFLTGTGLAEGDARLRVGASVRLELLGPLFNGKYYISAVRHTFDRQDGFRTMFRVERAGLGS